MTPLSFKQTLDLSKNDLPGILFSNAPKGKAPARWFEEIAERTRRKVEPLVLDYITTQDIQGTIKRISTLEELQKFSITPFPDNFTHTLADIIDDVHGFTSEQKFYVFASMFEHFAGSIHRYVNAIVEHKAQQLMAIRKALVS